MIAAGCGTRTVTMSVMRPAEITFPQHVNTLVLVDRTQFEKKPGNIIEGILTGEMPGEDRSGLQEAMRSFQNTIMSSPRFQVLKANEVLTGNSLTQAFPAPLDWAKIEELCAKYQANAVVAFEMFDTDFIITDGQRKVKKKFTENGVEVEREVDEFWAQGVGNATIGIRLYDPKVKTIVDEQLYSRTNTWQAVGNSKLDALAHLIAKTEATKYVAGLAGSGYAYKIAPLPVRVSRQFYSKSNKVPQVATGSRKADVNDWQGAINTWQSGLNNAHPKDAGKLCYNIAIAYEVLGDLNSSKQWVSRAWTDYGNKKARDYSRIIDQRIREEERLREQMK